MKPDDLHRESHNQERLRRRVEQLDLLARVSQRLILDDSGEGDTLQAAKILIAEDELLVAQDLAGLLTRLGYTISGIAQSGEEAIALARATLPDLALMDIRLKGAMDGVDAAAIIRKEVDAAVVYLSGNSERATRDRAKPTEPFAYLLKPFDEMSVKMCLEMVRSRRHLSKRDCRLPCG